MTKMGTITIQ